MIPIETEAGVNLKFTGLIVRDIRAIPKKLLKALSDKTTIKIVNRLPERIEGSASSPAGWDDLPLDYLDGLFLDYDSFTEVYIAASFRKQQTHRWNRADRRTYVVYHELGHVVGRCLGEGGRRIYMEPDYKRLYLAARDKAKGVPDMEYFVQDNWVNGACETFAECVSILLGYSDDPEFEAIFADVIKWVDQRLAYYFYN